MITRCLLLHAWFIMLSCAEVCGQAEMSAKERALQDIRDNKCNDLVSDYNDLLFAAHAFKGNKPTIPVPPVLDPDCHDCKEPGHKDKIQPVIDAFIEKSLQPESDMLRKLLRIIRDKSLLLDGDFKAGDGLIPGSYKNPDAYACLNNFDDHELDKMLLLFEQRLDNKASMMLAKYGRDPDRFIGGVALYLTVLRNLNLLGYTNQSWDEELAPWIIAYYEKYKRRLFDQHQYQLYPGIFYLPHTMALMGAEDYLSSPSIQSKVAPYDLKQEDEVINTWNKAIASMHFKLKITYVGDGFNNEGDRVKVRFSGEAEIRCRVGGGANNSCYNWELEQGKKMIFKIEEVELRDVQNDKDTVVTTYAGPNSFSVPVQFNVNMCDATPVFRMFFDRLWPEKEIYHNNHEGNIETPILYRLVSATLGKVNTGSIRKEVSKMKAAAREFSEADMEAWNSRMEAHAKDPGYFDTEQGKRDLAIARQLKEKFGSVSLQDQEQLNKVNDIRKRMDDQQKKDAQYFGSASWQQDNQNLLDASKRGLHIMQKATGGALSLNKLELPFVTGKVVPVDGAVGDDGGSALQALESGNLNYHSSFHVRLENAPDDRDHM